MELSELGRRIKAERKRQGLTLEVLAERVGISRNFLWEIEAGRKAPALNTLYNLGVTLNISIDYLMGVTEDNRRIHNDDSPTKYEMQISKLLKQLHGFDNKELDLISNVLNEFMRYTEDR